MSRLRLYGVLTAGVFLLGFVPCLFAQAVHHPGVEGGETAALEESQISDETSSSGNILERSNNLPTRLRGYASHNENLEETKPLMERVEWNVSVIGVMQGNTKTTPNYASRVDGSFTLDLEALVQVTEHGSAYGLIQAGNGAGIDGRVPTFSGFNGDAMEDSDFQVSELWYQHEWCESRFRFRIGKVDLTTDFDCNEYANDENTQFLSGGFINNMAVEFPDYAFGGMFWMTLCKRIDLGYGYAKNDNEWEDLFHNGFHIAEVIFKFHFIDDGCKGHLRFYGWCNAGEHADFAGIREDRNNCGWGISYDDALTERLGVFLRYGSQRENVSEIGQAVSAGLQLSEPLFGRTDDVLGFAWGCCLLSDDYRNTCDFQTADEHHLELYYNWQANRALQLCPNFQWVANPEGNRDADDVCVLGLRLLLSI
ncbi:MAG: carbohydrate porin [Planctomycetia bacterium]|nr:carbohydrate porin [Planctomycetia bacterium]